MPRSRKERRGGPGGDPDAARPGRGPAWDFEAGERLVEEAESEAGAGRRAAIDLERGRLYRSSGDPERALPLFESAFALALEADEGFLAGDAAHMAALAAPDARRTLPGPSAGSRSPSRARRATGSARCSTTSAGHYEAGDTPRRSTRSSARSPRGRRIPGTRSRSRSPATRSARRSGALGRSERRSRSSSRRSRGPRATAAPTAGTTKSSRGERSAGRARPRSRLGSRCRCSRRPIRASARTASGRAACEISRAPRDQASCSSRSTSDARTANLLDRLARGEVDPGVAQEVERVADPPARRKSR